MPEQVFRAGHWWHHQDDGSWLRWDQDRGAWLAQPGPPPEEVGAYRNPRVPWRWVVALLALGVLLDAVAVGSDVAEVSLLSRIAEGAFVSESEATASDTRQGVIGLLQLSVFLATAGPFIWWFHTVYSNLPALGATGLRFRRGWAVGAWFVPFLNLIRPKAMADDVWRASDPALPPAQGESWKGRSVNQLLHWWWGTWILGNVVGWVPLQLSFQSETVEQVLAASRAWVVADLAGVVSGVLALLVVVFVTQRQLLRASVMGLTRQSPVAPR